MLNDRPGRDGNSGHVTYFGPVGWGIETAKPMRQRHIVMIGGKWLFGVGISVVQQMQCYTGNEIL